MGYWTFNGTNGLKGVAGTYEEIPDGRVVYTPDPTNPAVLNDETIVYMLTTSRIAREEFNRIYPTLLPEEQERLDALLAARPRLLNMLFQDPQAEADAIQRKQTTSGVRLWRKSRRGRS